MNLIKNQKIIQIGNGLTDCLPSKETMIEILNNILITVFFIVIGYLIYYHIAGNNYSSVINCTGCFLMFKNEPFSTKQLITSNKFTSPINGYCFSFVLFISEFYNNVGSWRHIMHKGSNIDPGSDNNFNTFNSEGTNRQTPGLWLHPNKNNIRVVLSLWNTIQNDYFDVENVPIGEWITISINILNNTCELYLNGLLVRTHEALRSIEFSGGDCYLLYTNNASWGKMKNVRYIPNFTDAKVFAYINQQDNIYSKSN